MKILFFNWRDITNPRSGGAEVYIHEIAKRLATSHEVVIFCSKYDGCRDTDELDNVKVIRRGGALSLYFYAFFDYLFKLRKEKFNVIIDSINCVPFFTPLFIRKPKIAIIYHLVNKKTISQELSFPADLLAWLAQRLIPLIYRNINFITISDSSYNDLIQFGIPRNNLNVIYCGINHDLLSPGIKSNKPIISYVGVIKRYKQLDHLLKAYQLVRNEIPKIELVIAGKRDCSELKNQARKMGLENSINFMGEISEKEKVKILQRSHVFAICSVKEGWGISVIEANACGTPAIAYDVPGLRDSIQHQKTGLLVSYGNWKELANTLVTILKDSSRRENLSKNALKWAANFNWDKSADDFMKIVHREGAY